MKTIKINQRTCSRAISWQISIWPTIYKCMYERRCFSWFFFINWKKERPFAVSTYHFLHPLQREREKRSNAPKIIFLFHKNTIYRSTLGNVEPSTVRRYTTTASKKQQAKKNERKLKNKTNAKRKKNPKKEPKKFYVYFVRKMISRHYVCVCECAFFLGRKQT